MKVLLIEDEIQLQNIFKLNFEDLGFEVRATDSVERALEIYSNFNADVILSDIKLAGKINGDEIINLLEKKYPISPPVILMSGGHKITKEIALKLGAKNFLNKPFKFKEICIDLQHITLLNNSTNRLFNQLSDLTACHSIGIRLIKGIDYPYFKYKGFTKAFVMQEKFLCGLAPNDSPRLECMCGIIIEGKINPSKPFFTERGSFYSNHTTNLLSGALEEDLLANTRNYCNKVGYESVALIPIKSKDKNIGLIQLNDYAKNKFTDAMIGGVEDMATKYGKELEYLI